ncbi:MAG: Circadian clock protein KaiC central region [Gemmatimonadetes bacterium]|nr:Circadian clock protein KaiC central region [Gemmatimonadota bacterium]
MLTRKAPFVPPVVERASTGIHGLDQILGGGLPTNHIYLVDGEPGTGKTTLALQFLLAGVALGERVLYVTLSESADELAIVAGAHGWSTGQIDVYELGDHEGIERAEGYTIFHPAEVELQHTVDAVFDAVKQHSPARVVFDSLSEMRLLARDPLRFRRQILALKQFFMGRQCTVLLLDDKTAPEGDLQLHSLAHGVIVLEHVALEYGAERRRLQVTKLRGIRFRGGYHDFRLQTGGTVVFPRIHGVEQVQFEPGRLITSGSDQLDALLGGGLQEGTSLLITGPAGTGKSVLCSQYACAAVNRNERVLFYLFDERMSTFKLRGDGLGMDLSESVADGRLDLRQVEPTELSPGEFANQVVRAVEEDNARIIVIDSINGYMQSMPEERLLPIQVHELLSYLANKGVTCIMTLVQRGIFGSPVDEAADISYLADAVVLLRYFEVNGMVRQAISVVKKRSGNHERTIRECRVTQGGLDVGNPISEFQGVLTGVPTYTGSPAPLMANINDRRKPTLG